MSDSRESPGFSRGGAVNDKTYKFTLQRGRGDRFEEFEAHIMAPNIFRAAEIFRLECEQKSWLAVAIEEVDDD